jgi:hypothetical protein
MPCLGPHSNRTPAWTLEKHGSLPRVHLGAEIWTAGPSAPSRTEVTILSKRSCQG